MTVPFRVIALSGGLATLLGGAVVSPALFPEAFAAEPQKKLVQTAEELFPSPFDPRRLQKFDFTIDDSVSTKAERTQTVSKIAFGRRTTVSIVTTSSGTYSSDAITSPNVRYPGISVAPKYAPNEFSVATRSSDAGTWTWTKLESGSFTFVTSHFTPAQRPRS